MISCKSAYLRLFLENGVWNFLSDSIILETCYVPPLLMSMKSFSCNWRL